VEVPQSHVWAVRRTVQQFAVCGAQHVLHSMGHMGMSVVIQLGDTHREHAGMPSLGSSMQMSEHSIIVLCIGGELGPLNVSVSSPLGRPQVHKT
jgi:hypothetical protein